MAIESEKRAEWRLAAPPDEAAEALRAALDRLQMRPEVDGRVVTATSPRSFLRNRWGAAIEITLSPLDDGSAADCMIRMSGDRHLAILDEIAAEAGPALFADRGAAEAAGRLGTLNGKQLADLERLLRASERVLALGEGRRGSRKVVVALTDERLFLFDPSTPRRPLDEFSLPEVTALRAERHKLVVEADGARAEVEGLSQAEELAARFRALRPAEAGDDTAAADPIVLLERLAVLRDNGVIEPAEFEAKKAELLRRI